MQFACHFFKVRKTLDIHAKVLNDKELHSQRISAEDEYQT